MYRVAWLPHVHRLCATYSRTRRSDVFVSLRRLSYVAPFHPILLLCSFLDFFPRFRLAWILLLVTSFHTTHIYASIILTSVRIRPLNDRWFSARKMLRKIQQIAVLPRQCLFLSAYMYTYTCTSCMLVCPTAIPRSENCDFHAGILVNVEGQGNQHNVNWKAMVYGEHDWCTGSHQLRRRDLITMSSVFNEVVPRLAYTWNYRRLNKIRRE